MPTPYLKTERLENKKDEEAEEGERTGSESKDEKQGGREREAGREKCLELATIIYTNTP